MSQSLAQIYTHLIYSTKHRAPFIMPDIRERLSAYIGGIMRGIDCPTIAVGVVADHVHVLYRQSKKVTLIKAIEEVKTESSKWMKEAGEVPGFFWQGGYGAFSVSASRLEVVRRYVLNQEEHHRHVSFQEEFVRFLKEYEIPYDERYLWE